MVDDLLDMSLLEADRLKLERKSMEPGKVISETLNRLAHVVSDQRLHVVVEPGLAPVFVDPMRVGQVLGNLVSNAVKYGDKDAEIIIEAHRFDHEVEIVVTNHGPGIDPADLKHIFNRFARSKTTKKSSASGLGLGLYIANGVIKAHGGRMWAESTPGKTTTFHMTLPTVAASKREAA